MIWYFNIQASRWSCLYLEIQNRTVFISDACGLWQPGCWIVINYLNPHCSTLEKELADSLRLHHHYAMWTKVCVWATRWLRSSYYSAPFKVDRSALKNTDSSSKSPPTTHTGGQPRETLWLQPVMWLPRSACWLSRLAIPQSQFHSHYFGWVSWKFEWPCPGCSFFSSAPSIDEPLSATPFNFLW